MKVIHSCKDIHRIVHLAKEEHKIIGFVPTMGALHQGHLALLEKARAETDVLICSIFVNPTQFNNPEDFNRYPRDVEKDMAYIQALCDVVFLPSVEEMYPTASTQTYDFGDLDKVMEGMYRPGHFHGVAMIVQRLFEITEPHFAYFGKKDFQQALIIKRLVGLCKFNIQIVLVDTLREDDGLAYSSRNVLLSKEKRKEAPFIYNTLLQAKKMLDTKSPQEIQQWIIDEFQQNEYFDLEYVSVVDAHTLGKIDDFKETNGAVVCIAAYLDKVRLIDNLELYKI